MNNASVEELVGRIRLLMFHGSDKPSVELDELALRAAERARLQEAFEEAHAELGAVRDCLRETAEALRENVGDAYNLLIQGESPTQRRGPSAQRIYDRSKTAGVRARRLLSDQEDE